MSESAYDDIMRGAWHVRFEGGQSGPFLGQELRDQLLAGEMPPDIYVWRNGMADWVHVLFVPEFVAGMKIPLFMISDPAARKRIKMVRNAKQNTIAMFVVLLLWVLGMISQVIVIVSGPGGFRNIGETMVAFSCFTQAGLIAGLFAAIYLPLRWRVIKSLPSSYRNLGLIGGIGLLVLLALSILSLAAAALPA